MNVPGSDFFVAMDAARAGEVPAIAGKGAEVVAAREGIALKGTGQDQWQAYHVQSKGQFQGKGKCHQDAWDSSVAWWQP